MRLRRGTARLAAIPLALFLCAALARPAEARGWGIFSGCLWGRLKILRILRKNDFEVQRDLSRYSGDLGPEYVERIASLGPDGHVVDAGAGEARAMAELAGLREPEEAVDSRLRAFKGRVTAIAYAVPRSVRNTVLRDYPARSRGRFRYLAGRFMEEIPAAEIGKADVLTDVFGPLTYTMRLDQLLNRYLEILKPGGTAFTSFLDSTKVILPNGRPLSLNEWIESFDGKGIRVTTWPDHADITKISENFRFPKLKLISTTDHPPIRVFQVIP